MNIPHAKKCVSILYVGNIVKGRKSKRHHLNNCSVIYLFVHMYNVVTAVQTLVTLWTKAMKNSTACLTCAVQTIPDLHTATASHVGILHLQKK